jgi:hypothetical protein
MRALVKTLFLEPDFHVVTSAGWADAYSCVERIAGGLVEGGCGGLPVAAVRGSNVLPILDMLEAEGVDLANVDDGTPWRELRHPVLAADLQIGAGPIATALAEKARVIVAGCYDGAAPAVAHAVTSHQWSWHDYSRLAAAAVAARVATWRSCDPRPTVAPKPWQAGFVELEKNGRLGVTSSSPCTPETLQAWLRSSPQASDAGEGSADVVVELANAVARPTSPHQLEIDGIAGNKPDGRWRLEILYQAGYSAETLLEFSADADASACQFAVESARANLHPGGDTAGLLRVDPLQSLHDGNRWLRLAYQTASLRACQFFVESVGHLADSIGPQARLAMGPPRVLAQCGLWSARIPRDAVDIAVETRLAKEWL